MLSCLYENTPPERSQLPLHRGGLQLAQARLHLLVLALPRAELNVELLPLPPSYALHAVPARVGPHPLGASA